MKMTEGRGEKKQRSDEFWSKKSTYIIFSENLFFAEIVLKVIFSYEVETKV